MLALLDRSSATNNIWLAPERGGSDVPLDGEVGLGPDDTAITAIRLRTSPLIRLNDDDSPGTLDIGGYFDAGGDGNDLTLTIRTAAGAVAVAVATAVSTPFLARVDFDVTAAGWNLLNDLAVGDRFILAFARPAKAPVAVTFTAPTPSLSAALTVLDPARWPRP